MAGGRALSAGSLTITAPMTSSMRCRIAWSSVTPAAFTFSWTCSGRDAPTMAAAYIRILQRPGDRELGHRQAGLGGDRAKLGTRRRMSWVRYSVQRLIGTLHPPLRLRRQRVDQTNVQAFRHAAELSLAVAAFGVLGIDPKDPCRSE